MYMITQIMVPTHSDRIIVCSMQIENEILEFHIDHTKTKS